MSEQDLDLEKLSTEVNINTEKLKRFAEKYAEAATAEANKRIEALEGEVAKLHKFIYWECDVYLNGQNPEFSKKYRELLSATPTESLQEVVKSLDPKMVKAFII